MNIFFNHQYDIFFIWSFEWFLGTPISCLGETPMLSTEAAGRAENPIYLAGVCSLATLGLRNAWGIGNFVNVLYRYVGFQQDRNQIQKDGQHHTAQCHHGLVWLFLLILIIFPLNRLNRCRFCSISPICLFRISLGIRVWSSNLLRSRWACGDLGWSSEWRRQQRGPGRTRRCPGALLVDDELLGVMLPCIIYIHIIIICIYIILCIYITDINYIIRSIYK